MGAWIETYINKLKNSAVNLSLPIWERGLKPVIERHDFNQYIVAPYMGAWIET